VRVAARAIAHYVLNHEDPERGVCIGWDTRFGSEAFAKVVAEVLAVAGIPAVVAKEITPTPALSYAVRERKAAGGVMITSSHNPAQWNGVKYKASYGGSGRPAIMSAIESYLGQPLPDASAKAKIEEVTFNPEYVTALARFVDLHAIHASKFRFLIDDMYGCGRGVIASIFSRAEIPFVEIRSELNPLFPGINPEPILPHIKATQEAVVKHKCDAGLITDGDADRIGAVDEHGNVVDAHKVFAVLLNWLLERRKWPGDVTRAFNTTKMIDRIAATPNIQVHTETTVAELDGTRDGLLERVHLRTANPPKEWDVAARFLFLFIGAEPNTAWVNRGIALDDRGFIVTGQSSHRGLETSSSGVFAIGDVRSGSVKRVAACVGEGAAVVAQIHSYLASLRAPPSQPRGD